MSTPPSGSVIARYLTERLPRYWDGRTCIEELRRADYQWKQMEWIGWWFEFRAMQLLAPLGAQVGPTFGSVTFDCSLNGVWDFKTHPRKPKESGHAYLNDEEAVDMCIASHQHLGWIIAVGTAVYDETGDFKRWHEELKGAESKYVAAGRKSGRKSRKRKAGFILEEVVWLEFRHPEEVEVGLSAGVLRRGLQAGQANSDGSSRRPKYGFSYARWRNYLHSPTRSIAGGRLTSDQPDA